MGGLPIEKALESPLFRANRVFKRIPAMFRRPKSPSRVIHPIAFDSSSSGTGSKTRLGSFMLVPPSPNQAETKKRVLSPPLRALAPSSTQGGAVDLERRLASLLQRVEDQAGELERMREKQTPVESSFIPKPLNPRQGRKISRRHAVAMRLIFQSNLALRMELAGAPPIA